MLCITGVSTTLNVLWKPFSGIALAMQLHHLQMSSETVLITGLLVLGLLIMSNPLYTPVNDLQMKIGFGFRVLCQISNFYCHILLRNLRGSDASGGYQIPRAFLFNIVTCANYTTEIYQWLGFNVATQTVAGYVFMVVAAAIMTNWAIAKHRRLRKLFDGKEGRPKYPRRWVILPPFL